jgi:hypothetical protein
MNPVQRLSHECTAARLHQHSLNVIRRPTRESMLQYSVEWNMCKRTQQRCYASYLLCALHQTCPLLLASRQSSSQLLPQ